MKRSIINRCRVCFWNGSQYLFSWNNFGDWLHQWDGIECHWKAHYHWDQCAMVFLPPSAPWWSTCGYFTATAWVSMLTTSLLGRVTASYAKSPRRRGGELGLSLCVTSHRRWDSSSSFCEIIKITDNWFEMTGKLWFLEHLDEQSFRNYTYIWLVIQYMHWVSGSLPTPYAHLP